MSPSPTSSKNENPKHHRPAPQKQIRFVSNDGQPHAKRRRISAACSTCRRRKTRCSGERPLCKTCLDGNHTCLGYPKHPSNVNDRVAGHQNGEDSSSPPVSPADQRDRLERAPLPPDVVVDGKPGLKSQASAESASNMQTGPSQQDAAAAAAGDNDKVSESPASNSSLGARNKVPYFRYFGPTAIVPGFKQMVVQVKENRRNGNSLSGGSPASTFGGPSGPPGIPTGQAGAPSLSGDHRSGLDIQFYDATDPLPNHPLIFHLCETFFRHLGCNFPFLQRERFLKDLEEKRVDAILVDAVCAIAARFSNHPLLSREPPSSEPGDGDHENRRAMCGQPFAHRAMAAIVETFSCPTPSVTQASLLLAYDEFGCDHDSGLWMYLGIAIRMAQDLGMQKLEGLRWEGHVGPTPKTSKTGEEGKAEERRREAAWRASKEKDEVEEAYIEDQRASERERLDTFWAIFFLDRVISSGTGRPVTLRDKDIEISFPAQSKLDSEDDWPAPFPPLIRVIHLYGRVTDVLNNIKEANHVTPETLKKLTNMENELTGIYQHLSPKLHFNAVNFQHYVKAEQGTNFILMHVWFHTLIVLLHQPTLFLSYPPKVQQILPKSRELAMSSAKTIADMLAFAELIDLKAFLGNPFCSQPLYIAACAFLTESAIHSVSQPTSPAGSPPAADSPQPNPLNVKKSPKSGAESPDKTKIDETNGPQKSAGKHTLLASAANQNYQRCYQALKSLETYWAGTRYILTVLDQKAKGIGDPILYTAEDIDSAVELPRTRITFNTPGWRRAPHASSLGSASAYPNEFARMRTASDLMGTSLSPIDPSQAIGWSLTGTTNSPNPNLSFLFQTTNGDPASPLPFGGYGRGASNLPLETANATARAASSAASQPNFRRPPQPGVGEQTSTSYPQPLMPPPPPKFSPLSTEPASTSDAEMLLGLHSPYSPSATRPTPSSGSAFEESQTLPSASSQGVTSMPGTRQYDYSGVQSYLGSSGFGDMMMIESQDVDMTSPHGGFQLPMSGDLVPWLEYLPQDVLNYFGDPQADAIINPSGPGPPSVGSSGGPTQ